MQKHRWNERLQVCLANAAYDRPNRALAQRNCFALSRWDLNNRFHTAS